MTVVLFNAPVSLVIPYDMTGCSIALYTQGVGVGVLLLRIVDYTGTGSA